MLNIENQLKILVLGCSSAGKSTFIDSTLIPVLLENQYVQTRGDIEVFFAGSLELNYNLGQKKCAVVHYNNLLAFDSNPYSSVLNIESEPVFKKILEDSFDEVFYCYCPDSNLLERIQERELVEPNIRGDKTKNYPKDHILNSFLKISQRGVLLDIHSALQNELRNFSFVFSQHNASMVIPISDFIQAPSSAFLEKILCDENCKINLLKREFHRYSPLAAKCAESLTRMSCRKFGRNFLGFQAS
jgi:hypothetical protein